MKDPQTGNGNLSKDNELKPLTRQRELILMADLDTKNTSVKQIAEVAGCTEQTVYLVRKDPNYLLHRQQALDERAKAIGDVGRYTKEEISTALTQLSALVKENPTLENYAGYVKLLSDVVRTIKIAGWTPDTTDDEDMDGTVKDLRALLHLAVAGGNIESIIHYYISNGFPPTTIQDLHTHNTLDNNTYDVDTDTITITDFTVEEEN